MVLLESHVTLVARLRKLLGVENVLSAHCDLVVYECDAFVIEKRIARTWPFFHAAPRTWRESSSFATN